MVDNFMDFNGRSIRGENSNTRTYFTICLLKQFFIIFATEYVIMLVLDKLNLDPNLNNFIDSFTLTCVSGTLIYLFVTKAMILEFSKAQIEKMIKNEKLNYYAQQVDGLNRTAIVAITDPKGKIKYVNEFFCSISGYSEHELLGRDHRIINSGFHSKEYFKNLWKTLKEGQIWKGEMKNKAKDGHFYWLDTTIIPIKNQEGIIIEYLAFRYDITEKKETDILYRDMVESTPEGFLLTDSRGKILEANYAFLKLSGHSKDELLTMHIRDLEAVKNAENYREHMERIIQKGFDSFETQLRSKDGQLLDIEVKISHLPARGGLLTVFVHDITERKNMVKSLENEKNIAQDHAAAKTRFLSAMSHEIRTPMNGISGMASLLLDTQLKVPQKEMVRNILSCCNSLLTVINDILDFSKLELGKVKLEKSVFNIDSMIYEVTSVLDHQLKEKKLRFNIEDTDSQTSWFFGDASRIKQVLFNLLGNAIKFTEKGEITLKIKSKSIPQSKQHLVEFSVQDTGIGISEENVKKLFQPFSQVDGSITKKFGGTGLGLSISKGLVEQMGGEISYLGEAGKGSVFTFSVKLEDSSSAELFNIPTPIRKTSDKLSDAIPLKILIADDNKMNQVIAQSFLTKFGYHADTAMNGKQVLQMISLKKYDLILMDCHMPEMDGFETTRILKNDSRYRDLVIVAMTASAMKEDRDACFVAGMDDFISKPVKPSDIETMIQKRFLTAS